MKLDSLTYLVVELDKPIDPDLHLRIHPINGFLDYLAEQIAKELISEHQNELMEGTDDDAS